MKNLETPGKTGRVGRYVDLLTLRKVLNSPMVAFFISRLL